MSAPNATQLALYDSKAQMSAEVIEELRDVSIKGWAVVRKYYPNLGTPNEAAVVRVNPSDDRDGRFISAYATEDSGHSPIPLISMICSLDPAHVSGKLATLRAELEPVTQLPDYANWTPEQLRQAITASTSEQTTTKGVRYRAPRASLSLIQSVELYAMTVALIAKDDKWQKWAESVRGNQGVAPRLPDFQDFSRRLQHQIPVVIPPGGTRGLVLYLPGWDIAQPLKKGEFEERMEIVRVQRSGNTFRVEQFPVFLTNEQKEWNPDWLELGDEQRDITLSARKALGQWTRLDGPYLWFKWDMYIGPVTFRSTVKFAKDDIIIEGERFVRHRGDAVRAQRDPNYDPLAIERFENGVQLPEAPMVVDLPELGGWAEMRQMIDENYQVSFYRPDDRELFWYRTNADSLSSSLMLRDASGPPSLRPHQPARVVSRGIVARYDGTGVERPLEVSILSSEEQGVMNVAVGLMNACLLNAGGEELNELRTSLPHDQEGATPIFFYAVRNGTSVVKAPTFEVVVLPEGYYSDVATALNRLLWVLEKPLGGNAAKAARIQNAIGQYLLAGPDETIRDAKVRAAWTDIAQSKQLGRLFDAAILPKQPLTAKEGSAQPGDSATKPVTNTSH